jgi:hypothetical protein
MARGADREAHSLYLQVLAERGLLGALPFVGPARHDGLLPSGAAAPVFSRRGFTSDAALARAYGIGLLGYFIAAHVPARRLRPVLLAGDRRCPRPAANHRQAVMHRPRWRRRTGVRRHETNPAP